MQLHVILPAESPATDIHELAALTQEAERLGYDGVWLPDHLLPPGPYGPEKYGGVHEPLTALAYLAAVTRRVTLGTSVLILPLRDPLLVARQAATLARMSGGRFVLGVGAGWEEYEFDAARADFATRGARTTSALRLIRQLHESGGGPYEDAFHSFDERAVFQPVPEHPVPFLIGGNSNAALRRTVQVGDWWQGVGLGPREFAGHRARLRELSGGREIHAGARIGWDDDGRDVGRDVGEVREEVEAWRAVEADHLAVWFGSPEGDGFLRRMRALAEAVGQGDRA
ncbi:oxidoreductase [Streptomyces bingchenggensis BCW-1]|uniref:Oxidoreductase n=2 Tax=Streptomyces TaxID=1883 RepID=D7BSC2_STRBB|nr:MULTISPECIES: TIGR03619 family F420-dependent LLM class oxidoreductase [Streptomyces]ADI09440.1 oxidoreductase [Streptomyces bingchenggensis BCW-1]